jgi:hypothetical protein
MINSPIIRLWLLDPEDDGTVVLQSVENHLCSDVTPHCKSRHSSDTDILDKHTAFPFS